MTRGTRKRARWAWAPLLGAALALAACGSPPPEPPAAGTGGWHVVELDGVKGASGIAVLPDFLVIVAGGNERRVFLLAKSDLVPGKKAAPRPLQLVVSRDNRLEGTSQGGRSEAFAAQGYRLGDVWDKPLEFSGVAARYVPARGTGPAMEAIYVLERTFGIVFRGRLLRDPAGALEGAQLEAAFALPERDRSGSNKADWRDQSAGLAGILSVETDDRAEDLYLAERAGPEPSSFRVLRVDRFGQFQGMFTVSLPEGAPPDVGDLSWTGGRFVFVRGEGRGALVPCADPGDYAKVVAGAPVPAPDAPGAGPWRGLAHAPDGTAYLVSAGSPSRIAWRPVGD